MAQFAEAVVRRDRPSLIQPLSAVELTGEKAAVVGPIRDRQQKLTVDALLQLMPCGLTLARLFCIAHLSEHTFDQCAQAQALNDDGEQNDGIRRGQDHRFLSHFRKRKGKGDGDTST